jgi:hypothetical protein
MLRPGAAKHALWTAALRSEPRDSPGELGTSAATAGVAISDICPLESSRTPGRDDLPERR